MFQRFPHAAPRFCVKPGGQLVEENQLRLWDQRQYNKKPLAFAAGKTFYRDFCFVANFEQLTELAPIGTFAV